MIDKWQWINKESTNVKEKYKNSNRLPNFSKSEPHVVKDDIIQEYNEITGKFIGLQFHVQDIIDGEIFGRFLDFTCQDGMQPWINTKNYRKIDSVTNI
jgi:hypothetical protein